MANVILVFIHLCDLMWADVDENGIYNDGIMQVFGHLKVDFYNRKGQTFST